METKPCEHTLTLEQVEPPRKIESQSLAHCSKCDLRDNLWLCLVCGSLGCGRKQFDGSGGNSHGLEHFETTGHGLCCKIGTITPEGSADLYCYLCNDEVADPNLGQHLHHFGIEILNQQKTEKSMAELQLDMNMKFDFSMTTEDGKQLEPVFGPGLTGLKNLGNSCYMASVLQALFSVESVRSRYLEFGQAHIMSCESDPTNCYHCQMAKMADGLCSGRYSVPTLKTVTKKDQDVQQIEETRGQDGIPPTMFKNLVGKGHPEFSTMRQQDASEFFEFVLKTMEQKERPFNQNPGKPFSFALRQRLQCLECQGVRYSTIKDNTSLTLPVPARKAPEQPAENDKDAKPAYLPVTFDECLRTFTEPEMVEFHCPQCQRKTPASKSTKFQTFPEYLLVSAQRFVYENWVPAKLNIPITMPTSGDLDFGTFRCAGKTDQEVALPEDTQPAATSSEPTFDPVALEQLMSMGFPEIRCKRALMKTGHNGAEVAMNWLFEHMEDPDIDAPLETSSNANAGAGSGGGASEAEISMLCDMGFTPAQARKALKETSNNVERAIEWLFSHAGEPITDEPAASSGSGDAVVEEDNKPARYHLSSFISHKGTSVHCGHYVAHLKKDDKWVLFNDNKVVDASATVDKAVGEGYLYLFKRN